MSDPHPSERYSFIKDKNPREIVLLRGSGCRWRRCRFCNYHLDFSHDQAANDRLNFDVLSRVAGITGVLEVINSGSFSDLSENTLAEIVRICEEKTSSVCTSNATGRIARRSRRFAPVSLRTASRCASRAASKLSTAIFASAFSTRASRRKPRLRNSLSISTNAVCFSASTAKASRRWSATLKSVSLTSNASASTSWSTTAPQSNAATTL